MTSCWFVGVLSVVLASSCSMASGGQPAELLKRLSHINIGEMVPYYIMRYGFYEGHTGYRTDPIDIAFIFGLRTVQEIEAAFPGKLREVLSRHFTPEHLPES